MVSIYSNTHSESCVLLSVLCNAVIMECANETDTEDRNPSNVHTRGIIMLTCRWYSMYYVYTGHPPTHNTTLHSPGNHHRRWWVHLMPMHKHVHNNNVKQCALLVLTQHNVTLTAGMQARGKAHNDDDDVIVICIGFHSYVLSQLSPDIFMVNTWMISITFFWYTC